MSKTKLLVGNPEIFIVMFDVTRVAWGNTRRPACRSPWSFILKCSHISVPDLAFSLGGREASILYFCLKSVQKSPLVSRWSRLRNQLIFDLTGVPKSEGIAGGGAERRLPTSMCKRPSLKFDFRRNKDIAG